MNRLSQEKSPYLLQHAANPVDWRPWGEEAFSAARELDRPIFLSIGYATCHWCHVMAHESFEDRAVGELMNAALVCIKVDREERPDVDEQYMTVCGMLTGSGGWPLTIVMTPQGMPFFAGTYISKPGMLDLIPKITSVWRERREEVEKSALSITGALRQSVTRAEAGGLPGEGVLARAFAELSSDFDEKHGGFGSAPKFPMPHVLSFLLRYHRRTGDRRALRMVEETLLAMRGGGIYDHVGWGFHRYSTDDLWLVPHFEKMLYDQALLAIAYVEAYELTGKELYARTAREVLDYVLRDLRLPEGGFASAEDADSEGEEGKFYLWPYQDLAALLGSGELRDLERLSHVAPGGNWSDHTGAKGDNIIHVPAGELLGEPTRAKLLESRERRPRPLRDDKLLADWNGLAIAALSIASRALSVPAFVEAAAAAAEHILRAMRAPDGGLLHRERQGEAAIQAYATDYAFLSWGLLELYESTLRPEYLRSALELAEALLARFVESGKQGAATLYLTAKDAERLLVRPAASADGALPAAVSVAVQLLFRLARMTGRADLEDAARSLIRPLAAELEERGRSHAFLLGALGFLFGPAHEIVIAGRRGERDTEEMIGAAQRAFRPNAVLLFRDGASAEELAGIAPFTRELGMRDGRATAYVCRDRSCDLPTTDPREMLRQIGA